MAGPRAPEVLMRRRPALAVGGSLAALLAAVAVVLPASAASADPLLAGGWDFSDGDLGTVAPGRSFGTVPLYAAGDRTSLSVVSVPPGQALDVVSWRGLRPGQAVSRTASMLSTDRDFWRTTKSWGSDGTSTTFDPGAGDFSVGVWVRPTDAAAFPRGSKGVGAVSPNIVQKGRSNAAGGFWKLSLQMVRTATGVAWAPECAVRGADGVNIAANRGGPVLTLVPGAGTRVTCSRVGDRLVLSLLEADGSERTASVGGAAGLVVSNKEAVSVAHKPGTTSALDVYDGLLSDLVVTTG